MVDTAKQMFKESYSTPKEISLDIDRFVSGAAALNLLNPAVGIKYAAHFGLY